MDTLHLRVEDSPGDGFYSGLGWSVYQPALEYLVIGCSMAWAPGAPQHSWLYFPGVNGRIAKKRIISADLNFYGSDADSPGVAVTKIFAERAASPISPVSQNDGLSKVRTGASVTYPSSPIVKADTWYSIDISPVIQELANDFVSLGILLLWDDTGSVLGAPNFIKVSSYDRFGGTVGATLDIIVDNFSPSFGAVPSFSNPLLLGGL